MPGSNEMKLSLRCGCVPSCSSARGTGAAVISKLVHQSEALILQAAELWTAKKQDPGCWKGGRENGKDSRWSME